MKSQNTDKRMGMIIRIIPLVILFLTAGLLPCALATEIETDSREKLQLRQHSIEPIMGINSSENDKSHGVITIYIHTGTGHPVDAKKVLKWIDEGVLSADGVLFDTEQALVVNSNRLLLPFSFTETMEREYLESMIRVSGESIFQQASTSISLYEFSNHLIFLSLSGDARFQNQSGLSGRGITGTLIAKDYTRTPGLFSAYHTVRSGEQEEIKKSFIYRNRFWLIGASALAISGTTAIISSAGGGPVYLPEPPGRP